MMIVSVLNSGQAEPVAAVRHRQPSIRALRVLMFIYSLDAPNEGFNRLARSPLGRKGDELEHFVVASLERLQLFHSREERINTGIRQLGGVKAKSRIQRPQNLVRQPQVTAPIDLGENVESFERSPLRSAPQDAGTGASHDWRRILTELARQADKRLHIRGPINHPLDRIKRGCPNYVVLRGNQV